MARRVVVTGVGMVTPCGLNTEDSWEALKNGESGIAPLRDDWLRDYPGLSVSICGEVRGIDPNDVLDDETEAETLDTYTLFALSAAKEAWAQAGLPAQLDEETGERAGAIIGVGMAGYHRGLLAYERLKKVGPEGVEWQVVHALTNNLAPSYVARRFGLNGINYASVSACTSGAHGIGEAFLAIKHGRQDLMLAGGIEGGVSPLTIAGFAAMRALSAKHNDEPEIASRPFEKGRDGFVLGEGAGVVVLEAYEHAKARGATILAEVLGYGASEDAHHITAPSENGEGMQRSMRQAVEMAGLKGSDIDYVNAHGTSTPLNDLNEGIALRAVLGEGHATSDLLVSSTKSMTGHLLGGAGGIEAVISVCALRDQVVPPNINYDEPDPEIPLHIVTKSEGAKIRTALSNSFGFGGTNGTLLFGLPS